MKRLPLLFAVIAFSATASFAKTSHFENTLKIEKTGTIAIKGNTNSPTGYICTAKVIWKSSNGSPSSVTITVDCRDCTSQQQACDKAYAIARIAIPQK